MRVPRPACGLVGLKTNRRMPEGVNKGVFWARSGIARAEVDPLCTLFESNRTLHVGATKINARPKSIVGSGNNKSVSQEIVKCLPIAL